MKHIFLFLATFLLLSCNTTKNNLEDKGIKIRWTEGDDYEVVSTPIVNEQDTSYVDELRIYRIESANDARYMMTQTYGGCTQFGEGKYQDNINQLMWKEVSLLSDEIEKFTILTDGTETGTDYFSSIIIFDSENRNCLADNYPNREAVLNALLHKLQKHKTKPETYEIDN